MGLEQSLAKQKQLFHNLQEKASKHPRQLLGDMPIQWSSTYVMLDRAKALKEFIEPFLHTISSDEKNQKKRQKLSDLIPTKKEWNHVGLILKLLTHAENVQQAFSTDQGPTLHLTIPALEALHAAWSKCHNQTKYKDFVPALDTALQKVQDYYKKTAKTQVYTFAMCTIFISYLMVYYKFFFSILDPSKKSKHLHRY
ncbi:hypothetical protein C0991_011750 [Blastosporella zonata]|nr:hypothetical protein C0991_011750 [Blastosporella zonata]